MEFEFIALFEQFNTQESYIYMLIGVVAFLLGLLVNMFLQGAKTRQLQQEFIDLKQQYDQNEQELADTQAALVTAKGNLTVRDEEIGRFRAEYEAARTRNQRLEQEKEKLFQDVYAVNSELEKAQATNQTYLSTIEDLNNQILGLRAVNEHPATDAGSRAESVSPMRESLQEPPPGDSMVSRLEAIEHRMLQLESENISLKQEIDELKGHEPVFEAGTHEAPPSRHSIELEIEDMPEDTNAGLAFSGGIDRTDDLTMIHGIGPLLERRLNEIGIYTYEQIARWNEEDIDVMTARLDYFEGRIQKDDWVGQAQRLFDLQSQDPDAFHRLSENTHDPSDLQVVEGIGPEVEALLNTAGIHTWEDLANSPASRLRELLDAGGPEYRLQDPTTWPVQARLAVNGDWDLLEEYQQQLVGGRTPDE